MNAVVSDDRFLDSLVDRLMAGAETSQATLLRKYGNIIEWIVNGIGLQTIYDYNGQFQTLRNFYQLLCPQCNDATAEDCWGKTSEQLKQQVLLQLDWEEEVFKCPKCGFVKARLDYDTLVACVGMRSTKTATAALISSYTTMMWFALGGRLDRRYNLLPGQRLRVSMVATSGEQTEHTIWGAYTAVMSNLTDETMKKILVEGVTETGEHINLFQNTVVNTTEWRYNNLEIMSLHSNSSSVVGGTGLLVVIDEFSRFDLGSSKRSADEVFSGLERSLKTIRGLGKTAVDDLFGRLVVVSAPFHAGMDEQGLPYDPTLRLIATSNASQLNIHKPTWGFNPKLKKEDFDKEYKRDYWKAERDYGANPKGGVEMFFEYQEKIIQCIEPGLGFSFKQTIIHRGGVRFISCEAAQQVCDVQGSYVAHVDLSEKRDLLSMVIAKKENDVAIITGILVLKPELGLSVWVDTPLEILLDLSELIDIKLVTYDRWNSLSSLQRLQSEGIPAKRRSVGEAELLEFKNQAYLGKVKILDTGDGGVGYLKSDITAIRRLDGKLSHTDVLISTAGAVVNLVLGEDNKGKASAPNYVRLMPRVTRLARWA